MCVKSGSQHNFGAAAEREGNISQDYKDVFENVFTRPMQRQTTKTRFAGLKKGSRQGHNQALSVLFAPNSLDSNL